MTKPTAYSPEFGYKYQILVKTPYDNTWEHCDYAKDTQEKNYLWKEYSMAYGQGTFFKCILLPEKYWKAENEIKYILLDILKEGKKKELGISEIVQNMRQALKENNIENSLFSLLDSLNIRL